jgi:hypothetical protein
MRPQHPKREEFRNGYVRCETLKMLLQARDSRHAIQIVNHGSFRDLWFIKFISARPHMPSD